MSNAPAPAAKKKSKLDIRIGGLKKATVADIALFTRQLATLLDAGLPLVRSIKLLQQQQDPGTQLSSVLKEVVAGVESGKTFSDSLSKFPKVFDALFVNMVRAGEAGGVIETVLNRLADFSEKSEKLKKRVKGAMTYPIVILTIALLVCTLLLIFVIPKFQSMFEQQGNKMPFITQCLIDASHGLVGIFTSPLKLLIAAGVIFVLVVLWKSFKRSKGGAYAIDRFLISAPLFGPLIRKSIIARFTRTLGTLLNAGVPILQALDIVKDAVGNLVVSKVINNVHASIKEGESVTGPMIESGIFDGMVTGMLSVGEETGTMAPMLLRIADTYDDDVDAAVDSMSSIIEPLLIVFLAVIVGTVVIAMFLPMTAMLKGVGGV